jgi:hypothetical protein
VLLHAIHGTPWRTPAGKALRAMTIEDGMGPIYRRLFAEAAIPAEDGQDRSSR